MNSRFLYLGIAAFLLLGMWWITGQKTNEPPRRDRSTILDEEVQRQREEIQSLQWELKQLRRNKEDLNLQIQQQGEQWKGKMATSEANLQLERDLIATLRDVIKDQNQKSERDRQIIDRLQFQMKQLLVLNQTLQEGEATPRRSPHPTMSREAHHSASTLDGPVQELAARGPVPWAESGAIKDLDFQITDTQGRHPLHIAALHGQSEMLKWLASDGVGLEVRDHLGHTPLHLTVLEGKDDTFQVLLDQDANPLAKDAEGSQPMHLAASKGNLPALRHLKSLDLPLEAVDSLGRTPLHRAAMAGELEAMGLLLDWGAPPNEADVFKRTPLMYAVLLHGESAPMVDLLVKNGALLDLPDFRGRTALHLAAGQGRQKGSQALLQAGSMIFILDEADMTPLHVAVAANRLETARFLLMEGAGLEHGDLMGRTPLHLAIAHGSRALVMLLLKAGADTEALDDRGKSVREWARELGREPWLPDQP